MASAGKIGSANIVKEKSVTAYQKVITQKTDTALSMSGSMNHFQGTTAKFYFITIIKQNVWGWLRYTVVKINAEILPCIIQHVGIITMYAGFGIVSFPEVLISANMVSMTMCVYNILYKETMLRYKSGNSF